MAGSGLRSVVNDVVAAAAEHLGFAPRVGFEGPVDSATSAQLQPQVIAVLTEALSNVVRHAQASAVEVVIAAENGTLVVSVADNGVGPSGGAHGRQRAAQHIRTCPRPFGLVLDHGARTPPAHWSNGGYRPAEGAQLAAGAARRG